MIPEWGVRGASLGSRCEFDPKARPETSGTTECARRANAGDGKAGVAAVIVAQGSSANTTREELPPDPEPFVRRGREEERTRYLEKKGPLGAAWEGEVRRPPSTSTEARRNSHWRLAGIEVRAFGGRDRTILWRLFFRAAMLLSLVAYTKRIHPSGEALCLLWLKPLRFLGGTAALLLVVCTTCAIYPLLGAVLVVGIAGVLLPCAIGAVRARPGWKELAKATPPGRHIYVHSVASQLPGAGAELLRALALEADDKHWSLVLDASNEKLVRYYEQFGFEALGAGVQMTDGARHVRMWRPPITQERGPVCGRTGYGVISTH
jgi:hypothetical protein